MKRHNRKSVYVLLGLVFLVAIIIALYLIYNKTYISIDEPASLSESNCREYYGWFTYPDTGWIEKSRWNNLIVTDHPFDFANVWYNMSCDNHPIFYHSVIHIMYSLFPYSYSMKLALIPNFICYLVTGLAIFFISNRLTKNGYFSVVITAFYLFNPLSLENMLLIRMYMMTEMFVTLFALLAVKIAMDKQSIWNYLFICIVTTCGCLTHYFFYFAMAFISLFIAIYLIVKHQFLKLLFSLLAVIGGILLGFLIFPTMYDHLFGGTGDASLAEGYLTYWDHYPARWNIMWQGNPFGYMIKYLFIAEIILLAVILIGRHGKFDSRMGIAVLLLAASICYFGLCAGISAYADHRYISPIDGLFIASSLCVLYIELQQLNSSFKNVYFLTGSMILIAALFIYTLNFSVFKDQYKNSGIQLSKEKSDDICIVISAGQDPNQINEHMFELSNYSKVYVLNIEDTASYEKIDTSGEAVVYVREGIEDSTVNNWLKTYTDYSSLQQVEYHTYDYTLYTAE